MLGYKARGFFFLEVYLLTSNGHGICEKRHPKGNRRGKFCERRSVLGCKEMRNEIGEEAPWFP